MSDTKKTSLQKAILEVKEIEKAAIEKAKKIVEESMIPKIEETVKETVMELEEGVTIEVGDANFEVSVENGKTSIEVDAEEDDLNISSDSDDFESDEETEEFNSEDDFENEESDEDSENDFEDEDEESDEDDEDDEIFEIEGLEEEEEALVDMEASADAAPAAEAPADAAPTAEAPADAAPADAAPAAEAPADETEAIPGLEELSNKLDTIISKLDAAQSSEESEEETEEVGEEAPEELGAEGEVEIVDDEMPAEETPAEEEMVSEDDFMEITFGNEEEDDNMFDIDLEEIMNEIEIVDENEDEDEEEDNLDETGRGLSFSTERTGNRERKMHDDRHHSPVTSLSENKTQKEAKIAELEQENASLRESLKEYKESFFILRKQINEVQTFNAKLAYVNKLFSKGGLTNDEKIQIAEDFDRTSNAEEAKALYNKIISENKEFKDGKTDKLRNKLKSASPAATPSTQTETLYESKEISRMKLLAGINYNTSKK